MKDLVVGSKYQKNGEEKVSWSKVGILIEKDGRPAFIKLNMFPDLLINIFEQKERGAKAPAVNQADPYPQDDDLPF